MQPPTSKTAAQSDAASNVAGKNKNYGKVPSYLNKYAKQRDEEVKRKADEVERSKHPPGTRLMPEDERRETLADLMEAREATDKEL